LGLPITTRSLHTTKISNAGKAGELRQWRLFFLRCPAYGKEALGKFPLNGARFRSPFSVVWQPETHVLQPAEDRRFLAFWLRENRCGPRLSAG
jgi:hypothetical protein